MKVISLYSGADGFGDGVFQADHEVILAIDVESDCLETIKLNHPDTETICGKVGDYIESLPKADAIIGGPPCPEFSRANTGRSFDMCEINNFNKAVEFVKPKYFLMENVQDVKKKLIKHNFLINAADYGVPQTRIRRFFTNMELPSPTHAENPQNNLFGNTLKRWVTVKEALGLEGLLEDRKSVYGNYGDFRKYSVDNPSPTVVTDMRLFISPTGFTKQNGEFTRDISEKPSQTIMASSDMVLTNYRIFSLKKLQEKNPIMTEKHKPNYLDKPMRTVDTKDRGQTTSGMITDGVYARKLTNEELAILQGFRKDYKFFGGKTSVRKQIGNAVPSPISKAFFSGVS